MSDRRVVPAWIGAALAVLLLALSLTGDGRGPLGDGRFAHPALSYALAVAVGLLVLAIAGRGRPQARA